MPAELQDPHSGPQADAGASQVARPTKPTNGRVQRCRVAGPVRPLAATASRACPAGPEDQSGNPISIPKTKVRDLRRHTCRRSLREAVHLRQASTAAMPGPPDKGRGRKCRSTNNREGNCRSDAATKASLAHERPHGNVTSRSRGFCLAAEATSMRSASTIDRNSGDPC